MEFKTRAKTSYALLREIQRLILEEPLRIDMSIVCLRGESLAEDREKVPSCETVGCIAGWVEVLTDNTHEDEFNMGNTSNAQEILGLDNMQARELFMDDIIFDKDKQTIAHARKVSVHIEKFLKANEQQLKNHKIIVKQ